MAAVGVIVYTSNVRKRRRREHDAGARLDAGHPGEHRPRSADRAGRLPARSRCRTTASFRAAVTDVAQLQGQTATAPIYQNEQIPLGRISSGGPRTSWASTTGNIGLGLEVRGSGSGQRFRAAGRQRHDLRDIRAGHPCDEATFKVLLRRHSFNKALRSAAAGSRRASRTSFSCRPTSRFRSFPPSRSSSVQNPPVDTRPAATPPGRRPRTS